MKIIDKMRLDYLLGRSFRDTRNQNLFGITIWGPAWGSTKKDGMVNRRMIDTAIRAERRGNDSSKVRRKRS